MYFPLDRKFTGHSHVIDRIYLLHSVQGHDNNFATFYDPISPGSSRRSSEMSNTTTGGQSLPPPPSSHLLATHLQRLQNGIVNRILGSAEHRLSVPSISTIGDLSSTVHETLHPLHMSQCMPDRRMSEPVNFGTTSDRSLQSTLIAERPRSVTPSKLESTIKLNAETNGATSINVERTLDVSRSSSIEMFVYFSANVPVLICSARLCF